MSSSLLSEPINRFWYGYLRNVEPAIALTNGYDPDLERLLVQCVREAFTAGARWQLRESAKLSPYISRFLEMCILLGPDSPRDIWHELETPVPRPEDEEWLVHVPF